ncbi:integral membrane protein DGCR2/IDD isoform X2 [Ambystoma mexicanum]|uniref:integral membrane protein DGCR2/IDD isoform X2 n=1 Tax=Ambystoma mexicanum TaxID=8296 RepID=UPI0037E85E1E
MVAPADSGAFLLLLLLVLTLTEPLRPEKVVLGLNASQDEDMNARHDVGAPELRCTIGQFACHSGTIQCIPLHWQCDGWPTCEDGSDEVNCPGLPPDQRTYHGKENVDLKHNRGRGGGETTRFHTVNVAQSVRFTRKCPTGWHHYEGTASCYKVFVSGENYWDASETCQKVNGSLATFTTDQELKFILSQEWNLEERVFGQKDQRRFWVGYQFIITGRNITVEGHWEVAYKGSSEVFLPPVPIFASALSESENVLCAQLLCVHFPTLRRHGFHSWYAENCYEKSAFLCKRSVNTDAMTLSRWQAVSGFGLGSAARTRHSYLGQGQTCVDIKDNIVDEGYYFTPKGDDPCLSCTCHNGEPEMCVAALCEGPQGCQQYRKDPKECCKFTCLDPDGNSLFDSMASGMRLIVSCISSFLILSLLLFMVHRLRQRRRERIESLIGANLHHFNLGRRMPGFDYGPDGFGTGLTPLHLSDDGEGGAFHFHEPPPPYTANKYPEIHHPDDPPPPYEASINPTIILCTTSEQVEPQPTQNNQPTQESFQAPLQPPESAGLPVVPTSEELEDSADSSTTLLVPTDAPRLDSVSADTLTDSRPSNCSLNTVV